MSRLSVIMPTYNASKYIKEALESILTQSFQDFELLIIDDNSTDETINIINSFENSKIRIIKGDCKGISAALNKGLKEAKGEYIARMDADDISLPERFEKQITFLDQNPEIGILGTKATAFFEDGRTCDWGDIQAFPTDLDMLFECVVCHPTVMFRKSILEKHNLEYNPEMRWAEDQELWFRALKITKFANIMAPLHKYRVIEQNASTKYKNVGDEFVWGLRKEIFEKYFPNSKTDHETIKSIIKNLKELIEKSKISTSQIPSKVHWTGKEFKEIIPIFYSSSPEMFPIMSASLTSVAMNTKNYIKIFVLRRNNSNYNEKEVIALKKLQKKLKNFEINYITVDSNKFIDFNLPKSNYITMETYFRYLLPNIDVNIDKAIYLDCDTICLKDITELYKENIGDNLLGATCQEKGKYMTPGMSKIIAKTGIKDPYTYFNAGVLVFNCKKFRENNTTQILFEKTNLLAGKIEYADQDILNIVCENKYKELDNKYNYYCFRINNIKDVNIIHFVGIEKPWNSQCPYDNYFWKYALMLPCWNNSKTRRKLIKRFLKNIGEELFSLKNQNVHKIIKIAGIKFKIKSKKIIQKRNMDEIKSNLYQCILATNNIKEELNDIKNQLIINNNRLLGAFKTTPEQKCLFLNDTSDDFHHGSCGTSFAIIKRLNAYFSSVENLSINKIRDIKEFPSNYEEFTNDDYMNDWIRKNPEIIEKIKNNDVIIVNGEGCFSYYKWNRQFAYITYLASKYFNKYVGLINTSIFNIENQKEEKEEWTKILGTTLNNCNFIATREHKSLINVADYTPKPIQAAFDCLPLYIDEDFKYTPTTISNYILITGGNNIPTNYSEIIYNIIKENKLEDKNIYFLFSDVKTGSEGSGDIKLYETLKHNLAEKINLELIKAHTIDEWLSLIEDAELLISGRFHHSIASYMLNTPFLALPTDTSKLESVLELIDCKNNLITNKTTNIKIPTKTTYELKNKILSLANRNFEFMSCKIDYFKNKENTISEALL